MDTQRFAWRSALENLLVTVWIGGLWISGYLVAPLLFASLDRQLAGEVAGQLFRLMSYIGLVAGGLLLISVLRRAGRDWLRQWRVWCLLTMLVLVVSGAFILQPLMQELKVAGLTEGSDAAARFGMLHGVSSVLYLITSLLGLWLIVQGIRPGVNAAAR